MRTSQRDAAIRHLKRNRISTGVHYMPLHAHPLFKSKHAAPANSSRLWPTLLTLPLHPHLSDGDVARVARELKASIERR